MAKKYNVVVRGTNEVVCDDCSHIEAMLCLKELIAMDKADGTFEKGFYAVREVKKRFV